MNMGKAKIDHVATIRVKFVKSTLEVVEYHIYQGQTIQLGWVNFEKEGQSWNPTWLVAFGPM